MTDPMGSKCTRGFRVKRPASFAVVSPKDCATTPWETSWNTTENTSMAIRKINSMREIIPYLLQKRNNVGTLCPMAQACAICGKHKSPIMRHSKLRGKYNPTVKQYQKPNLQWLTLPIAKFGFDAGARIKACTKCIKSLSKG